MNTCVYVIIKIILMDDLTLENKAKEHILKLLKESIIITSKCFEMII